MKEHENISKPEGTRFICASANLSVLPWEFWSLITDSPKISALTESLINLNTDIGSEGFIRFKGKDSQTSWILDTTESVEMERLKFKLKNSPWNTHQNVKQTIEIDLTDNFLIKLDGFDVMGSFDGTFFTASSWLWGMMSRITEFLGGNPEKCLGLHTGISVQETYKTTPEKIREMILTPEKAVTWLAEEVSIDTREGGNFRLRWERNWGEFALKGVLTRFKTDLLDVSIKDNPFGEKNPLAIQFAINPISDEEVVLKISITGIPLVATSTFSTLLLSDFLMQALLSLSIVLSGEDKPEPDSE